MLKNLKQFLLRGNLVELAVGFVIGTAFAALVTSGVENILTPLIAAIAGQPDFSDLTFEINNSEFRYGEFINALITFALIAAALFLLVVWLVNVLMKRRRSGPVDEQVRTCPECRNEVSVLASRCGFCTARIEPEATAEGRG